MPPEASQCVTWTVFPKLVLVFRDFQSPKADLPTLIASIMKKYVPGGLRHVCSPLSVAFQFIWKFLRRWCDLLQRNSYPIRPQAFGGRGIGQGSIAKTEEAGGWRADRWLGTISLSQGCFQMLQVCELWSNNGLTGSERLRSHYFLFVGNPGAVNADFPAQIFFPDPTLSGQEI
jgi:hypothetical protein